MPRKRMIDPSFWDDPDIAELQPLERLLVIGMISHADDYGNLHGHPAILKKQVFGYDNIAVAEVQEMRDRVCEKCRNIALYTVEGQEYIHLLQWEKHQKLNFRANPVWPKSPWESDEGLSKDCVSPDEDLTQDCEPRQDKTEQEKLSQAKSREVKPTPPDARARAKSGGGGHSGIDLDCRKALEDLRINGPTLWELLKCPRDDILAWCEYVKTAKGIKNPAALVVARLRSGEPPPERPKSKSLVDEYRELTGEDYGATGEIPVPT